MPSNVFKTPKQRTSISLFFPPYSSLHAKTTILVRLLRHLRVPPLNCALRKRKSYVNSYSYVVRVFHLTAYYKIC